MKTRRVERGHQVRFSIREDRLRVFLLPEGREALRDAREENARRRAKGQRERTDFDLFLDLIEDFRCNGWMEVRPEQVGDMRDDYWLVLTNDYTWADPDDDEGLIVGTAYSYDQYAVESYIDPLVRLGYIDFRRHDYLEPWEFDYAIAHTRPDLFDSEAERERVLAEGKRRYEVQAWEQAGQLRLPLEMD